VFERLIFERQHFDFSEVELRQSSVKEDGLRVDALQTVGQLLQVPFPFLPVRRHADGRDADGAAAGNAAEAVVVTRFLLPQDRRNDFQPVELHEPSDELRPVDVPEAHRLRHVFVERKIRGENAVEALEDLDVPLRLVPNALEAVVVNVEMHSGCVVGRTHGLVEVDQVCRDVIARSQTRDIPRFHQLVFGDLLVNLQIVRVVRP